MFYHNKAILITTLGLMVEHTNEIQLMENIKTAFESINENEIVDIEIREFVASIKSFSHDIFHKSIRTPKQAKLYFQTSDLPTDVKRLVEEQSSSYSPKSIEELTSFYSKNKHFNVVSNLVEVLNDNWDKLTKSGLSGVDKKLEKVLENINSLNEISKEISKETLKGNSFAFNPLEEESGVESFGIKRVEQDARLEDANLIKTGMWIDNLVGGGFRPGTLNAIAALPGGFKSGFMQNVAEYISCNHSPDDFLVPSGMVPAILYINLELKSSSINKRRCAFYGIDYNKMMELPEEGNESEGDVFHKRMIEALKEKGSKIPIIFKTELEGYSIRNIRNDIEEYERYGYKVMMVIADYLDLFNMDWQSFKQEEGESPLAIKAVEIRNLGIELKVPILTGAQLNRGGEEITTKLREAGSRDIVKTLNSSMIATSHGLKRKLDSLWLCHKYEVDEIVDGQVQRNSFFAIVVDKDREHYSRFVPSPDIERKDVKYQNKRSGDSRVYYVARLEGMKISNKLYSNTITDLVVADTTAVDIVSMNSDDDDE